MKSSNNAPETERTRASDRANERRLAALKRFSVLSYTDWSHRQVEERKKAPEFHDYEAYVERKHAERDALDARIKAVMGHA